MVVRREILNAGSPKICTHENLSLLVYPDSKGALTIVASIKSLATLGGNPRSKNPHDHSSFLQNVYIKTSCKSEKSVLM